MVKFCTDYDIANNVVPGTSNILVSSANNYGNPEDYSLFDLVYIETLDVHNTLGSVWGLVSAKHFPQGTGGDCYIVLDSNLLDGYLPNSPQIANHFQELAVLCGQSLVLP